MILPRCLKWSIFRHHNLLSRLIRNLRPIIDLCETICKFELIPKTHIKSLLEFISAFHLCYIFIQRATQPVDMHLSCSFWSSCYSSVKIIKLTIAVYLTILSTLSSTEPTQCAMLCVIWPLKNVRQHACLTSLRGLKAYSLIIPSYSEWLMSSNQNNDILCYMLCLWK